MFNVNHICPVNGHWPFKAGVLPDGVNRPTLSIHSAARDCTLKGYFPYWDTNLAKPLYAEDYKVHAVVSFSGIPKMNYCANFSFNPLTCNSSEQTPWNSTLSLASTYTFYPPTNCAGNVTVSGGGTINPDNMLLNQIRRSWPSTLQINIGFIPDTFFINTNNGAGVWPEKQGSLITQFMQITLNRTNRTNRTATYETSYEFNLVTNKGGNETVTANITLTYTLGAQSQSLPQLECQCSTNTSASGGYAGASGHAYTRIYNELFLTTQDFNADGMFDLNQTVTGPQRKTTFVLKATNVCPYFAGAVVRFRPIWKQRTISKNAQGQLVFGTWQNESGMGDFVDFTLSAGECQSPTITIPTAQKMDMALDYLEFQGGFPYVRP